MVKINEFFDNSEAQEPHINYDPGSDLLIFMQNDPMFYRKILYPVIVDLKDGEDDINSKSLLPVVDQGVQQYCKKFNIKIDPAKLFDTTIKMQVIQDILHPEDSNER